MDPVAQIDAAVEAVLADISPDTCPPRLAEAIRYAMLPGGARVRPKLTLAVARACQADDPGLVAAAAVAVELIHSAALVHDDLPCFDDAATRRGKPSVHAAYGQRIAVLCGDAMIVLAFEVLAKAAALRPERLAAMVGVLAACVGAPRGIIAGQAWECEEDVPLARYQREKTGALFIAATQLGAAAAGTDIAPWRALGDAIGEAYQVADDILDVAADPEEIGKPVGVDTAKLRPNSVLVRGMRVSEERLRSLIDGAVSSIPPCHGEVELRKLIAIESRTFMDNALMRTAAA